MVEIGNPGINPPRNFVPVDLPVSRHKVASAVVIGIYAPVIVIPVVGVPIAAAFCPLGVLCVRVVSFKGTADVGRRLVVAVVAIAVLGKTCAA